MRKPSFELLKKNADEGDLCSNYAQRMHPDPRFYKYRWWVFWEQSPVDGQAFLENRYAINTAAAMLLMDQLVQQEKPHWLYNQSVPRLEPGVTPFDPLHPRWRNRTFAPALLDDPDPAWNGHR